MKTFFVHKPNFGLSEFVVEKTIAIPKDQFEKMILTPMLDQDFLLENADLMRQDNMGVYHCVLVTSEGRSDGFLVESEGYSYARYAAYVPEVITLKYPSLTKLNQILTAVVDFIITDGTFQTNDGKWSLSFAKLKEKTGLNVTNKPFLQDMLVGMLSDRSEVADLIIKDNCFNVAYCLEFCLNSQYRHTPELKL